MNEQQFADELGALIDNRAGEVSNQLPVEDAAFTLRLLTLRDQTHADEAFADQLGAKFRSPFENRRSFLNRGLNNRTDRSRGRLVYTMATFAAALVIVAFAVLTVPRVLSPTTPATETQISVPTVALAEPHSSDYVLASAPLSSSFHVMGAVFHANNFAVNLIESAFTSYVNLMSSVYSDSASSS